MTAAKVSVMKMTKTVPTKLELAKSIVFMAACFNDIKLSNTHITVMAYFMVYGINQQSKNLIVKSGVCKNINNVKTVMVKLKKLGLIFKDDFDGKVCVSKALGFELTPSVCLYLKLENKV